VAFEVCGFPASCAPPSVYRVKLSFHMMARVAVCLAISAWAGVCADWNPKLAAQYLDARQKDWFEWPRANTGAKPWHFLPYQRDLSDGASRRCAKALGESAPTPVRDRTASNPAARAAREAGAGRPHRRSAWKSGGWRRLLLPGESRQAAGSDVGAAKSRKGRSKGAWNWFQPRRRPVGDAGVETTTGATAGRAIGGERRVGGVSRAFRR